MNIRAGSVPHLKTDYSDPVAGCHYSSGGFARSNNGHPFLIIEGHSVTESGKKIGAVCSDKNVQMYSLLLVEKAARDYMQNKTDDQIFIGEAIDEQTTLGFVCYDMVRRLTRIEQGHDNPDYERPLDILALNSLIAEAIADSATNPFRKPEHREIPLAQNYLLQRYGLWRPPVQEEQKLEAA